MLEREPGSWVEEVRGDVWSQWCTGCQQRFVELAVTYWRVQGFPYYQLTDQQIDRELNLLTSSDPDKVFKGKTIVSSTTGLRLANYFHPQMWHVRCTRYVSPYDSFCNTERLAIAIAKSLRIWPDRYGARAGTIRRMLRSFSNTVGVSNFRPTAARAIIHRYAPVGGRVLDFSAGYGGRLLGALTLGRNYVGIDPAEAQVRGLRKMIALCGPKVEFRGRAEIHHGPAEDLLRHFRSSSFDLIFSSPPYFNRERYGDEPEQSYIRFPSLDEWLEGFFKVVIRESARVLRKGGRMVLNVSASPIGLASLARKFSSPTLDLRETLSLQLARLPYKRKTLTDAFKSEPVLVFEKR